MKRPIQKFKVLMLLLVSATLLSSCSSDDDAPSRMDLLAHKWYFAVQEDLSTTPSIVTIANTCQQNSYYNFLSDGNLYIEFFQFSEDNCISVVEMSFTYELIGDGDQLLLRNNNSPESQIFNIEALTSTEMVFSQSTNKVYLRR